MFRFYIRVAAVSFVLLLPLIMVAMQIGVQGDSAMLVYIADPDTDVLDNEVIAVLDVPTGITHTIRDNPSYYADPRWSPDGERVLFVQGISNFRVSVMDADGRNLRHLTVSNRTYNLYRGPRWTQDGCCVMFLMNGNGGDFHRYDLSTDVMEQVSLDDPDTQYYLNHLFTDAYFSEDRSAVVVINYGSNRYYISVADPSNYNDTLRRVYESEIDAILLGQEVVWSKDNHYLAFTTINGTDEEALIILDVNSGEYRQHGAGSNVDWRP